MSLVSDPTILTKDRLREELQKHNVTLPRSDSKKSVYVDLYKRELLDKREKLEFSDDEIEFTSSKRRVKTPVKKPLKMKVTPSRTTTSSKSIDVTALSDTELSEKLQELGVNIGPVMDTTRKLYQKKLEKLLADAPREPPPVKVVTAAAAAAQADTVPLQDDFSDNTQDEEEDEPEPPKPVVKKSPARSERFEFKRSPLKPRVTRSYEAPRDEIDFAPVNISNTTSVTKRYTTRETNSVREVEKPLSVNNVVTQVPPPAAKENKKPDTPQKRRFPIWLQVAIFILLAISIFLVIQNMEPAAMNPFKSLPAAK